MNDHLTGAYQNALEKLSEEQGTNVTMIVEAVIESKQILGRFEELVQALNTGADVRKALLNSMVEQISSGVATMCNLVGKSFQKDILPLVEEVTNQSKKNLQ